MKNIISSVMFTLIVFNINSSYACVELKGLENVMMKSTASAEDILVSSMNRLGYGVHANSKINTLYIRNLEKTKGKRAAINIIAAEIRASFKKLEDPSYFPYRSLAQDLSDYPQFKLYESISSLKTNRSKMVNYLELQGNESPLFTWRAHTHNIQRIRKIADALNEKEFNIPGVITGLWFNHFNVDAQKAGDTAAHYELALKQKSCGTFYELLLVSAKHPAMLEYLDNVVNLKGKLNENYAREVIELHTLDTGPVAKRTDGTNVQVYTSNEIIETAKILSGWNYNRDTYNFEFKINSHESGIKKFNTLFNNTNISSGLKGGEDFFKLLSQQWRTKRNVCRKIGIQFYGRNPGVEEINKCAAVYGNLGNLPKMYEAFILSDEFWSEDKFFKGTKNPFDNLISSLRGMGVTLSKNNKDKDSIIRLVTSTSTNFGQALFKIGPPTGFKQLVRQATPSNYISNRIDAINRVSDTTAIQFDGKGMFTLENHVSSYIKKNGTEKSFDLIVNNIAPVFPSYIKNNRQIAGSITTTLQNPELQNNSPTPLKSTILRLVSSGAFLRK